jgi:hypothetical protein
VKSDNMPEGATDWSRTQVAEAPGASGAAKMRIHQVGQMQLRVVEYSHDYLGDHWCQKGHVIYVLRGTLIIEHEDHTPNCVLGADMSWFVGDDEGTRHRVRSPGGATIFVLD